MKVDFSVWLFVAGAVFMLIGLLTLVNLSSLPEALQLDIAFTRMIISLIMGVFFIGGFAIILAGIGVWLTERDKSEDNRIKKRPSV